MYYDFKGLNSEEGEVLRRVSISMLIGAGREDSLDGGEREPSCQVSIQLSGQ